MTFCDIQWFKNYDSLGIPEESPMLRKSHNSTRRDHDTESSDQLSNSDSKHYTIIFYIRQNSHLQIIEYISMDPVLRLKYSLQCQFCTDNHI